MTSAFLVTLCASKLTRYCFASLIALTGSAAHAEVYKCVIAGKTTYSSEPCSKDAKPATLKGNVTVVESKHFTGAAKQEAPARKTVLGVKVPNPVADCKERGGTVDKELRACILP